MMGIVGHYLIVKCDTCTAIMSVETGQPLIIRSATRNAGWVLRDGKDLCPDCK